MTNTPPESSENLNLVNRLKQFIRRPSTMIAGGTILGLGIAGYVGIQFFVHQKLTPLLETELSKFLQREVRVGKVESFSLNHLRIGESSIPATATDADSLSIQGIDIGFNLLPILLGRPLPLQVTIVNPDVYIEQDHTGKWLDIELPREEKRKLPFNIEADIRLKGADIALKPYQSKQIDVQVDGSGKYIEAREKQLEYELDVAILKSTLNLKGDTIIDTGKTEVSLTVKRLFLAELVSLIPQSSIKVKGGEINGALDLSVTSPDKIKQTQGRGRLNLSKIAARIPSLQVPIKADAIITLKGQTIIVDSLQASLSTIKVQAQGQVDLVKGYNIDVEVKPFNISALLKILSLPLPVKLQGMVQLQLKVTGALTEPIITGKINNDQPIRIDKLIIKEFSTKFETDLNQLVLKNLQILPSAGGKITGVGQVKLGILQDLGEKKGITWGKIPVAFDFNLQLPTEKLITPYISLPQQIQIGDLTAKGKIRGTFAKPEALLRWQSVNTTNVAQIAVSGAGEARWRGDNITLNNTILESDGGKITLNGRGNLKTQQWQTLLNVSSFDLLPLVTTICSGAVSLCPTTKAIKSLEVKQGDIRLSGRFDTFSLNKINGIGNVNLKVNQGTTTINTRLSGGNVIGSMVASGLNIEPFFTGRELPLTLGDSQINFISSIDNLLAQNWDGIKASANLQLGVANNPVTIISQLNNGIVNALVNTSQIPLTGFVPNLTIPVSVTQSEIKLTAPLGQLLSLGFSGFRAKTDLRLEIAGNPVNVFGIVENKILEGFATIGKLSLTNIIPQFPLDIDINKTRVNLSGDIQQLIVSFLGGKPDLSSLESNISLQLAVASGIVTAKSKLQNNQWQTSIVVSDVNSDQVLRQLNIAQNAEKLFKFGTLNAKATLSGTINSLLKPHGAIPIQVQNASLKLDEQIINARGSLFLANLFTNPDITKVNLDINAQTNLAQFPFREILNTLPVDRQFLPPTLDVAGKGQFQGRLLANNLLSAPTNPGNIQLNGNLQLLDFAVNERKFASILGGKLQLELGKIIAINLQGKQDIIAANFASCNRPQCLIPYLPVSFQLRQITPDKPPIIAQGNRQGDRLIAQLQEFPLNSLGIAPGVNYGIPGNLRGKVNLNLDINLFNLATRGQINVSQPGIGNIRATAFNGDFIYENQLAQLTVAKLQLGGSQYNIQGKLDFKTGAIQGTVNTPQGRVEDIINTLGTSDIDSILALIKFQKNQYSKAQELQIKQVGAPDGTLAAQINLLAKIEQQIIALADEKRRIRTPTQLDIRGSYQANLELGGTLKTPQFSLDFQGKNWAWNAQRPFPNIVSPLGLVIENNEIIPINEITLKASFANGIIKIEPARLISRNAMLFLQGKGNLLTGEVAGNFGTENFSVDTVGNFVKIPIDIAGNLNTEATLSGTIFSPKIRGKFAFVDAALNASAITQPVTGIFDYSEGRFQLKTNEPSFIQLYAQVPYPPTPENDRLEVRAKMDTEVLNLINNITQDRLAWMGGEGEISLDASGRLTVGKDVKLDDINVKGIINLTDAILKSTTFPEPLKVNGQIRFTDKLLNVENLTGTFAQSQIAITGNLPLFEPHNLSQPLNVVIQKGKISLDNLYQGGIDGQVVVTGTALKPNLGGEIRLSNGQVFLPKRTTVDVPTEPSMTASSWLGKNNNIQISFAPRLDDLKVSLQGLNISQQPIYQFNFGGELSLNGFINDLRNLRADGSIELSNGIFNFFDTRFLLNRRRKNELVFQPEQGLLNPLLDISMRTIVSEFPESIRQQRSATTNEIPDESLNKVRRIDVALNINGQLSQLLPGFGRDISQICQIFANDTVIPEDYQYSEAELQRLQTCIQTAATQRTKDEQLLSTNVVSLTSSPPRSQAEIIRLLGDEIFLIAQALQGKNTEQLLEYGVVQLAVPLILQSLAYEVETAVSKTLSMTEFRALPFLEAVYTVHKDGFVRFSYDYNFNEVKVRYETRF